MHDARHRQADVILGFRFGQGDRAILDYYRDAGPVRPGNTEIAVNKEWIWQWRRI